MAKFTEIFEDVTKKGVKIPSNLYLDTGLYPIIDQGQSAIAGYTNKADGLFFDVPAIIFGDHTRIFKYVEKPCFLGADGVKLLKAKKPNANHKYLYYALCNADIPNTGYNRHFKWLKEVDIPEYSEEEQEDIVLKLDKISHLIALRKRQLSKLDELVKSRFVEMFGDVVANDRRWPMAKFGDVTDSRLGKMLDAKKQTGRNTHKYLANFNVQWFRIDDSELHEMDFDAADQIEFELKEGDLLVCEGGESGRCCVWRGQIRDCYYQKALHRVRCNPERLNPDFLAYWFWMNCHHGAFEHIIGAKATIAHLPGVKLKKLDVILPPLALQREFAAFVAKVDKLAFKAKASLEKLETLKKAMMQKYFN